MRLLRPQFLMAALCIASATVEAQNATLTPVAQDVSAYGPTTARFVPVADFDGDGRVDLAVPAHNFNESVVSIVGTVPGAGWMTKQTVVAQEPGNANWPIGLSAARDATGAYLVLTKDSRLFVYGQWPLRLLRIIEVPQSWLGQTLVADVDADGALEIVTTTDYHTKTLYIHDLATGAREWETVVPQGVSAPVAAQLDTDAALEILVAGTVFDGATHATDWYYKDGFGAIAVAGRFGGGSPRFVGAYSNIVMFQGAPWSPLWDSGEYLDIESIAAGDLDGDGIDELIYPVQWPGGVQVFDVTTRSVRLSVGTGRVHRVAAGDFDGDGSVEIASVIEPNRFPESSSSLEIFNGASGALEHVVPAVREGPYSAALFALGEQVHLAQASHGRSFNSHFPGLVRAMSIAPGGPSWRTPSLESPDLLYGVELIDMHAVRLAGSSIPALVAIGRSQGQRVMAAFRADDGTRLWTRAHGSDAGSSYFERSLPFDRDGDGTTDSMFVCTNEQRIQEYRLADGALLWQSITIGLNSCQSLFVQEENGSRNIVGVFWNGLRAFDIDSRLLAWSTGETGNDGGALIANGVSGPELVIFDYPNLTFHDATTRTLLRTVNVDGSVGAVHQPANASIHFLLVTVNSRLKVIDGVTGEVRASSDPMGGGSSGSITSLQRTDGHHVIALGTGVGAFAFELELSPDGVFRDGFDRYFTPEPILSR